jgi:hypothetical protein
MMHDDDLDQPELRELLEERARVGDLEVEPLRRFVEQLPPRRRTWGRGILAAAAGIVVVLAGLGALALVALPKASTGAPPTGVPSTGAPPVPADPAYFANDPRLAFCHVTAADAIAIFELAHFYDFSTYIQPGGEISIGGDEHAPALVIVRSGPGTPEAAGATPKPGAHDVCVVYGTDASDWQVVAMPNAETRGLQSFKPEPTGTPIAADLLPWVQQCGGVDAGVNRVLQLPHGTDAMTLNSVQVPISLMTADPMTIVVYDGIQPFAPLGTPPAPGTTMAPRDPGYQDLCILVGSDPSTARRTIVEVGPAGEITDTPSGGPGEPSPSLPTSDVSPGPSTAPDAPSGSIPPASPSSILRPQINAADCAALAFSDTRCLAVVEEALREAKIDWVQVVEVRLAKPHADASLGSFPVADVTVTLADGTTAAPQVRCGGIMPRMPWCTDHPEVQLVAPYDSGAAGYPQVGCNAAGNVCSTPLPTINPTAKSVPLRVAAQDYPLVLGHQEILVGQATLPNGILSDGRFSLADVSMQSFIANSVELVVRSTDPSRPPFDNLYAHGWHPGSEVVNVYLVLDVVSMTPGATLRVRDLVVQ